MLNRRDFTWTMAAAALPAPAFAQTADQQAFTQLVERHAGWVLAAARRQLGDHQLAEDAVQVVFILLARRSAPVADRKLTGWLFRALHKAGFAARVEGVPHCDWVLIDASDVIVHVFRPEVRAFYNLEKMWMGNRAAQRAS